MGIKASILPTKIDIKNLFDHSFVPTDIEPADIDMSTAGQQN